MHFCNCDTWASPTTKSWIRPWISMYTQRQCFQLYHKMSIWFSIYFQLALWSSQALLRRMRKILKPILKVQIVDLEISCFAFLRSVFYAPLCLENPKLNWRSISIQKTVIIFVICLLCFALIFTELIRVAYFQRQYIMQHDLECRV